MIAVLFSAMAGTFAVIQSGMNKLVADHWGFSSSLLLNGVGFLFFNTILFVFVWGQPKWFAQEYLIQGQLNDFKLWWLLPGLLGFLLVMGLAVSVSRIGALQTMVISIAAQIAAGILWDLAIENRPITVMRLTGAAITFLGVLVATR